MSGPGPSPIPWPSSTKRAFPSSSTRSSTPPNSRQRGEPANLFYWQSGSVGEVDLVLDRGGKLYGIEVKATATPTPQHAAGLARWLDLVGPKARGVLACRVKRPVSLRPRIRAVPWHLAW